MDPSEFSKLETHEEMELMRRMSTSGQLQVLRTTLGPESAAAMEVLYASARILDPAEWMMRGIELQGEATLANYGLLELFRQTQEFGEYAKARESCKRAIINLSMMKQSGRLAGLTPGTPEFDEDHFFFEFMPGKYEEALIYHQGTIADAAGRGDLGFFKRLYNKVKNDQEKNAGGQYELFLTTYWLHGFFWLMPDKLACRVVASRMGRLFEAGENAGLESRKSKSDRNEEHDKRRSDWEQFKATGNTNEENVSQPIDKARHEKLRNRFRKAVKSLGLYQHPESPVVETKKPSPGEPNSACYVWKSGWPK